MTGGQTSLQLAGPVDREDERSAGVGIRRLPEGRLALPVVDASADELEAHARMVAQLERSGCKLWQAFDATAQVPASG